MVLHDYRYNTVPLIFSGHCHLPLGKSLFVMPNEIYSLWCYCFFINIEYLKRVAILLLLSVLFTDDDGSDTHVNR